MGIYPADSYPEEKTHNHAKYTYAPCLVVLRLAKIVKCGGNGGNPGSTRGSRVGLKAWPLLRIRCSGGLAETILSHHEEHKAHGALEIRRFPQIPIYESGKNEIRKWGRGIETRLAPALLGATHRAFTFYLGNPISSIETRSLPSSLAAARRGFTFYLADPRLD